MNLVLLFDEDFIGHTRVSLQGRRRDHVANVLKARSGDRITVGRCNGQIGQGTIESLGEDLILDVQLDQEPPASLPLTLVLALPRPHMFKRSLTFAACLGIKKIIILNFSRVDKSLWNSSALKPDVVKEHLTLGLEQAKDTGFPEVSFERDFKGFVTGKLPRIMEGALGLVAHPDNRKTCPQAVDRPVLLAIGPEGGILDHELGQLTEAGLQPVGLGPRILRVDAVIPYIVGRLYS